MAAELMRSAIALATIKTVDPAALLRALEGEGLVASEWDASSPGPAKRRYALTPAGAHLLDHWVEALRRSQERTSEFLKRYEERR